MTENNNDRELAVACQILAKNNKDRRVAIACQGGGSHTAFTAGALRKLLKVFKEKGSGEHGYDIVSLSGTSGGAICASLAWYGLLTNDVHKSVELLGSFWRDISANSPWDRFVNDWMLQVNRFFANIGGAPTISPYQLPTSGHALLKRMLEKHIDFGRIQALVKPSSPMLLIGAVDVCSGDFKAFNSRRERITADAILASTAIPTLFRAVHTHGSVCWDGLFSQNPPVRELCASRPDEIWVIQINPDKFESEPKTMPSILNRRNELAGNLSLHQEIFFIEKVNEWIEEGYFPGSDRGVIKVRRIPMLREFGPESKLDRKPTFIRELMAYGEEQAEVFLKELAESASLGAETPATKAMTMTGARS
jgi:NTE family protein